MTFVLDASTALAWSFSDEQPEYARAILRRLGSEGCIVPPIWVLEVANGFLLAERRGRLSLSDLAQAAAIVGRLPIRQDTLSLEQALGSVLPLARERRLSAYDSSYLELAMREGLPLATVDDRLRAAALAAGVPLAE